MQGEVKTGLFWVKGGQMLGFTPRTYCPEKKSKNPGKITKSVKFSLS